MPGSAVRIDVDPRGNPWIINNHNSIYRREGNSWRVVFGSATDISIGANGQAWIIGSTKTAGGYTIHKRFGNEWKKVKGGAVRIAVDGHGKAWIVDDLGNVF